MTTVADIMTRDVCSLSPGDSMARAAQAMAEFNVGVIPVCSGETLVGMVTDRDIVVRGVALGLACADTPLSDIMSQEVQCCFEDQAVSQVLVKMGDAQIRRLPVVNRDKRLVGILSLGDIAVRTDDKRVASVLQDISEPAAVNSSSSVPAAT